jgi:hypothetical protein
MLEEMGRTAGSGGMRVGWGGGQRGVERGGSADDVIR